MGYEIARFGKKSCFVMCKSTVVIAASLEVIDPCKCISMDPGTLSERSLCVSLGDSSADVSVVVA